jgi:hypothetical protein
VSNVVVRFPDGSKEFRLAERALVEGDVIPHGADRFRVTAITTEADRTIVSVELDGSWPDPNEDSAVAQLLPV